jgi:hypothetical protein
LLHDLQQNAFTAISNFAIGMASTGFQDRYGLGTELEELFRRLFAREVLIVAELVEESSHVGTRSRRWLVVRGRWFSGGRWWFIGGRWFGRWV